MSIGPMRRSDVKEFLGVSDWTLKKIMGAGLISRTHLVKDRKGRPTGRAFYSRVDVENLQKKIKGE